MNNKINIDKEKCVGCGMCESLNPDLFTINDSGIAKINKDCNPTEHKDSFQNYVDSCSFGAIYLED